MSRFDKWRTLLFSQSSSVAFISGLATILGLFAAIVSSRQDRYKAYDQAVVARQNAEIGIQQQDRIERANTELRELRIMNQAILESLNQVKRSGKTPSFTTLSPTDRQSIADIKDAEARLDVRLSSLETSIMSTPEKAVAVPMLKQQVDALQDRTHSDLDGIRGEIGRLFTLTQWFIGLMFTIALGMFGLSFNLRKAAVSSSEKT